MSFDVISVDTTEEIVAEIFDIIEKYHTDMVPYINYSVWELYDKVRKIPYNLEDGEFQVLARPKKILNGNAPFVACANKAILLGSYFRLKKIPFCLTVVTDNIEEGYNHIFPEIIICGKYLPIDATLSIYRLSLPKSYKYSKRLVYNG